MSYLTFSVLHCIVSTRLLHKCDIAQHLMSGVKPISICSRFNEGCCRGNFYECGDISLLRQAEKVRKQNVCSVSLSILHNHTLPVISVTMRPSYDGNITIFFLLRMLNLA